MTRVLVVDGSELMGWLVQHLVPRYVEVVRASTFNEATSLLADDPPGAAIFNLTPSNLNWDQLVEICCRHDPPVPFLFCSTMTPAEENEVKLPCMEEFVFNKPMRLSDLRLSLTELLAKVELPHPPPAHG